MKTSNLIASLFFGFLAAAAPYKRDLSTKTEVVVETVVVFTTVWDDGSAAAAATTTSAAAFFEQSPQASSSAAKTTSTSAYVAPVVASSTSVYVAPSPASSTSVYTPPVVPTSVYTPPSSVSSAAAATSSAVSGGTPGSTTGGIPEVPPVAGKTYDGGDVTVYNTQGGYGMCGTTLSDDAMIVSMGKYMIGDRITDVMTGNAVNTWCGKKLSVTYKDRAPIVVTVADRCDGCQIATDLDFTPTAWKALTGSDEVTRYSGVTTWTVVD